MSIPPGHLKNLFKCTFCWQIPLPLFLQWWSNAWPPSLSDQYTNLLVAIFNKHNCFSSIELHITGHEISHSNWKKDKVNGGNEDRMSQNKFFCCLQMPRVPGHYYRIYSCTSWIFWTWKWAQKIDLDLYSGEHETYLPNHKKMPKFTATSQVMELSK